MIHHQELFRAFPFLRNIPVEELERLKPERVEAPAGTDLFRQGDPGDSAWGVLTGRIKIVKMGSRGREVILEVIGPGELFAAIAVLRRIPMPASAVTLDTSACIKVKGPPFREVVEARPKLASRILETISRRLLEANTARLDLATEPVEARLARALLQLGGKFGAQRECGEVVFTQGFTRQNLADLAGTTVETTIRTISRWNREEIVASAGGRLVILQPQVLQELLDSAPN